MYKNCEGIEFYCRNCECTWDELNATPFVVSPSRNCPKCKYTECDTLGKPIVCANFFITCECGARVYMDELKNICCGCMQTYDIDGAKVGGGKI